MVSMTRNPAAGANTHGGSGAWQFYEQLYTTTGPQEWIALPDAGQSKVVLSFPKGSGSAFIEGTCSPPNVCFPANAPLDEVSPLGAFSPVVYALIDPAVTDTTAINVEGETAIRVNVLSGSVGISVRC